MRSAFRMLAISLLALDAHAEPNDVGNEVPTKLSAEVAVGTKYYPQELANSGAHGTVVLQVRLGDDGQPTAFSVAETSGSQELDELATSYLQQLKFSPVEGKALAKNVLLSVQFVKDSITNIKEKSCADFNADLAFKRRASSEASVKDMRVFNLATGLQLFGANLSKDKQLEMARNLPGLPAKLEQACAANPGSKFLDVFVNGLKTQ